MNELYVQYGCGHSAPEEWVNFDISPTLRIQKIPLVGKLLKNNLNTIFPSNVKYGDIVKGLPISDNACDGVYCSHTLEHLSLTDFRKALINTYRILKPGGIFRCVVPDLEFAAKSYVGSLQNGDQFASIKFMEETLLGVKNRERGAKGLITSFLGNSHHLWMWDHQSLSGELRLAGFTQVRNCLFNDSENKMFAFVEDNGRFINAVAIESKK